MSNYLNSAPIDRKDKNASKAKAGNVKSTNRTQNKNEKSANLISHEYFDQIDKLTTDLYVFVNSNLLASRRVLKAVHRHPYYGYRYDNLKDYVVFIKIFVLTDLCHIYKELRCTPEAFSNEGKLLFLYVMKALGKEESIDYEEFREVCNPNAAIDVFVDWRKIIEECINDGYNQRLPYYPSKGFLMQDVLEVEDIELMDMAYEYKDIMCQIALAVAKAKGKLTAKQSKWLSQLNK